MDAQDASEVGSIGLAVRACGPSLLHAIRGSLHDVSMLAALLEPPKSAAGYGGTAGEKSAQRLRDMQAQLKVLERRIALLGEMMAWPRNDPEAVSETTGAVADVLQLLKDEAARRRIRLESDVSAMPAHVLASESALKQALLTCGAWVAQRLAERATLRIRGRRQSEEALFEFEPVQDTAAGDLSRSASDDELKLLAALVGAAGGKLSTTPRLQVAFRAATRRQQSP